MNQTPRPTRSEQRDQARAKARELREKRAKGDKRKRLLTTIGIAVASAGVIAGVVAGGFVVSTTSNTNAENAKKVPANTTEFGGIIIGKGLLPTTTAEAEKGNRIVVYQEYQCSHCKDFKETNASQIKTWVNEGQATIEFHPISFLDGNSLNAFSSRAANAAFCVANSQPEKFYDANTVLYSNQPSPGTDGPSNSTIKQNLSEAGVKIDTEMNTCIDQKRYANFVDNKTAESAIKPAVTGTEPQKGTPYILVNGNVYRDDLLNPARFAQFFAANQK
jgi:protein-disulfide isomerase